MATTTPADNVSLSAWVSFLREKVTQLESSGGGSGSTISANDWADLLAFVKSLYVSLYSVEVGSPVFSNMTLASLKIFGGANRATDFRINVGHSGDSYAVPAAWYLFGDVGPIGANSGNKNISLLGHAFGGEYYSSGTLTSVQSFVDFNGDTLNNSSHYFAYVVSIVRKDQDTTNNNVTALGTRVTTAESTVAGYNARIAALELKVAALEAWKATVITQID
ncbi:hypothetical protein CJ014_00725 [Pleomorphomonas carboxyditropha]|uniref:Uncharacterized protein n=2 Tax=Pleomorphomonas carboxyditropha TaxID=2023338 RepID=A0A2G9X153_9HYPH|nr:hypothetical protein CJ014_00725 [Pleomorphomonas carboxyditropha]